MRVPGDDELPYALPLPVGVNSVFLANPVTTPAPIPRYLGTGPPNRDLRHRRRDLRSDYWQVDADGGVFTFREALFRGAGQGS